jgi:hypothetical protein
MVTKELPALKQHKLYLQEFWYEFGVGVQSRRGVSTKSYEQTIGALIELGKVKLHYNSSHDRKMFDRRKNTRKKFQGFIYCFACGGRAQVRHHIIWLRNGGRNQKNNVLALCNNCHAEIHPWLKGEL